MYLVVFSKTAQKDKQRLKAAGLETKAKALLDIIRQDPLCTPPRYEKLVGNLEGFYSRRITIQLRLVYQIVCDEKTVVDGVSYDGIVRINRMWTHYD